MEELKKDLEQTSDKINETHQKMEATSSDLHKATKRLVTALDVVYNKPGVIFWRGFIKGIGQGLGATIGVALLFIILSWLFRQLGGIPAFADWVNELSNTLNVPR